MVREGPHPPGTADLGRQAWEIMPQAGVPYLKDIPEPRVRQWAGLGCDDPAS